MRQTTNTAVNNGTAKFVKFIHNLIDKVGADTIKESIGDSTNNNRTLTISQVSRYLKRSRYKHRRSAATRLLNLKNNLSAQLASRRSSGRTDAYDILELSKVVNSASAKT